MKLDNIAPGQWHYPQWEMGEDKEHWLFVQNHQHVVGEVYTIGANVIKWHCKTSDWRDTNADTIDQAKAECEASFWKDQWEELRKRLIK